MQQVSIAGKQGKDGDVRDGDMRDKVLLSKCSEV